MEKKVGPVVQAATSVQPVPSSFLVKKEVGTLEQATVNSVQPIPNSVQSVSKF